MIHFKKITLLICIINALNAGLEGIFELDVLFQMSVHLPMLVRLFEVSSLFSGAYQILMLAAPE